MLFPKICQVKSTNLSIVLKYMCYMHIRSEAKRVSSFNNYGGVLIETNMHDMICVNITVVRLLSCLSACESLLLHPSYAAPGCGIIFTILNGSFNR